MRLTKFQITNFRSVEDSGEVDVVQTLCLVGKNEAGKTAVLQALGGLNPHSTTDISFDIERDYPRRFLPEYDSLHGSDQAKVIRTEWQLEEREKQEIQKHLGSDALRGDKVVAIRRYEKEVNRPGF